MLDIFSTLMAEKSVTRTAERLRSSQPSVSRALNQLQRIFSDPLFVRSRGGLVPTTRAQQLLPRIQAVVRLLQETVAPAIAFHPMAADGQITIATTDYSESIVLPPLAALLSHAAPTLRIQMLPLSERLPFRPLDAGEIDIAIGYFPDAPGSLHRQVLFEETFVAVVSAANRRSGGPLSIDEFVSYRHLVVAPWGGMAGLIDPILEDRGLQRTIPISTTRFMTAPLVVASAPYLVTLPRTLALVYARYLPLTLCELPITLPRFTITQLWHARTHHTPLHQWCRAQIVACCGSSTA